jgi:hypothetical protein
MERMTVVSRTIEGPDGAPIVIADGMTAALSAEETHALQRFLVKGEARTGRIVVAQQSDGSLTSTYDSDAE